MPTGGRIWPVLYGCVIPNLIHTLPCLPSQVVLTSRLRRNPPAPVSYASRLPKSFRVLSRRAAWGRGLYSTQQWGLQQISQIESWLRHIVSVHTPAASAESRTHDDAPLLFPKVHVSAECRADSDLVRWTIPEGEPLYIRSLSCNADAPYRHPHPPYIHPSRVMNGRSHGSAYLPRHSPLPFLSRSFSPSRFSTLQQKTKELDWLLELRESVETRKDASKERGNVLKLR
ncbi:hypothetical protein DFH06DRAFT_1294836 [Mycena polygramma]|nr:hypothetical protein DFH06DRAFT_1294836 [Mycena polygramma]